MRQKVLLIATGSQIICKCENRSPHQQAPIWPKYLMAIKQTNVTISNIGAPPMIVSPICPQKPMLLNNNVLLVELNYQTR